MKFTPALLALLLAACASTTEAPRAAEDSMGTPTDTVTELYDRVTFDAGTAPD